jgi:tetratricopeptide (TPR) repeat protein
MENSNKYTQIITELMNKGLDHHQSGRTQDAELAFKTVINYQPQHIDALHFLGIIAHQSGNYESAINFYNEIISIKPDHIETYINLGYVLFETGRNNDAIQCYQKAIIINPNYVELHNNLGNILKAEGRNKEAISCYKKAITLKSDYAEAYNNIGNVSKELGEYTNAINYYEMAVSIKPQYIDAHKNLGDALHEQKQYTKAILQYEKIISLHPEYIDAYIRLGNSLNMLEKYDDAIIYYEKAISLNPNNAELFFNLGNTLNKVDRNNESIICYEKSISIKPDFIEPYRNLGGLLERLNQTEKANFYLQKALEINPDDPMSIRHHSILLMREKKYKQAIIILEELSKKNIDDRIKALIHFDMGKLYDLAGNSTLATQHFLIANNLQKNNCTNHDSDKHIYLNMINILNEYFNDNINDTWSNFNFKNEDHSMVFLIGFPRSGTTLLDQILDSHPKIQVIEEKLMIDNIVEKLSKLPEGYPKALNSLSKDDIEKLRQEYLNQIKSYTNKNTNSVIIDKLPLNIVHIGLIHKLFPESKIILALRHPCDVCLSNFMQYFEINPAMANFFTIEDTANLYNRVMSLWKKYVKLFALNYIEVKYEILVEDFESETMRLLKFLDIDWDSSVLDYTNHAKNRKLIKTPSYAQVTTPIYYRSKYRWLKYKEILNPAMNKLEPFISYFGYKL